MKRPPLLLAVLALGALGLGRAQPPKTQPPPPAGSAPGRPTPAAEAVAGGSAQNWSMHVFSDVEGYRQMSVRGTEVHPDGPDIIAVTDLSVTTYVGDASAQVDTIMLSPAAKFFPKGNRASGDKTVRVIRDDFEATGQQWTYDHAEKRVSLHQNVRVVFHASLPAILK